MQKATRNQLANTGNKYQGDYPKVLFICSAGLLRSATAAHTFSAEPYFWNTRSAAANSEYGLNVVNEALLHWADEIYVMESGHISLLSQLDINFDKYDHKVKCLNAPDDYEYRDPNLVELLKIRVAEHTDLL